MHIRSVKWNKGYETKFFYSTYQKYNWSVQANEAKQTGLMDPIGSWIPLAHGSHWLWVLAAGPVWKTKRFTFHPHPPGDCCYREGYGLFPFCFSTPLSSQPSFSSLPVVLFIKVRMVDLTSLSRVTSGFGHRFMLI